MSTPTKGNVTNNNSNPNGNSFSINHTQNSGNNRLLVLLITMSSQNGRSFTGATYGGVPMIQKHQVIRGGLIQRMVCYYLENPPDGNNTVTVNFNASQFNSWSFHARSFTDCGGVGSSLRTGGQATPHSGSIIVEDDSLIMMTSCSVNQILTQQIPTGTNRTFAAHNTNRQVATGAISSDAGHLAGGVSLRATSTFGNVTLDRVEIKGLSSSPASQGNFFKMFIDAGTSIIAPQTSNFNIYSTDYDGIDARISMGNPANLDFEKNEDYSMSFWIKRPLGSGTYIIGGRATSLSPFNGYLTFIVNNKLRWRLRSPNGKHIHIETTANIPDDVWTNYVVTYNGTATSMPNANQLKIYQNGAQATTSQQATGNINNMSGLSIPFNVGSRGDVATSSYLGLIDEWAVFDYKLELADAQAIYGTGTPNDLNSLSTPPLSWWRFEEGSGTTALDSGTSNNPGTLTNSTTYSTDVP